MQEITMKKILNNLSYSFFSLALLVGAHNAQAFEAVVEAKGQAHFIFGDSVRGTGA
jgi:hypothetical protein